MNRWKHGALLIALVACPGYAATIEVSPETPIAGNFSLKVDAVGGGMAYVQLGGLSLSRFEIGFDADFGNLSSKSNHTVPVLSFLDFAADPRLWFQLRVLPDDVLFSDGLETSSSNIYGNQLTAGAHSYLLSIDIPANSVEFRIDNVLTASFSHDFGATTELEVLRFGLTSGGATSGTMRLDNFSASAPGAPQPTFFDNFETGNTEMWSATVP